MGGEREHVGGEREHVGGEGEACYPLPARLPGAASALPSYCALYCSRMLYCSGTVFVLFWYCIGIVLGFCTVRGRVDLVPVVAGTEI